MTTADEQQAIVERLKKTMKYSPVDWELTTKAGYAAREVFKQEAWAVIAMDSLRPYAQAMALLHVIECHYWRAREHLDAMPLAARKKIHGKRYSRSYELDIDVYTRHWLWANRDMEALQNRGCDLIAEVESNFGYVAEESKYLPKGKTCYELQLIPESPPKV